jgi:hypothetical protein
LVGQRRLERMGTGAVWSRGGVREDTRGRTPEERGRREEGEELAEVTCDGRRRGDVERGASSFWLEETSRRFQPSFGPYGVGNEHSLGRNSGAPPWNSGRILGLVSMPLQMLEFGSEFWNSCFQVQFHTSKQGVTHLNLISTTLPSLFSVIKLFEKIVVRIKLILVDQIKKTIDRTRIELHSISYLERKFDQYKPYIFI